MAAKTHGTLDNFLFIDNKLSGKRSITGKLHVTSTTSKLLVVGNKVIWELGLVHIDLANLVFTKLGGGR